MNHENARVRRESGQALFMLTFALFALCGMMGLAVDLGWSFFVKKAAQASADAAAMAAVRQALPFLTGGFTCGSAGAYCAQDPIPCATALSDSSTYLNLYNGCKYATANGFTSGGHGGRQIVTVQAYDHSILPPGAPGVNDVRYWVAVSVTETVPQMFSAVLGHPNGQVTARATAGAVQVVVPGSFYALNREGDCLGNSKGCGVDVNLGGNGTLKAPGGLVMASQCSGKNTPSGCDGQAGQHNGNGKVIDTPTIQIRTTGTADSNTAFPGWTNGGDGANYSDPTAGRGQPPIAATDPVKTCAVLNGVIQNNGNTPLVVGPYNYYAYRLSGSQKVATGGPIILSGNAIQFSPTGTCPGSVSLTGATQTSDFPSYFFHGGLSASNSSSVTFGSGQYVMVGAAPANNGGANPVFEAGGGNSTMATAAGATNMFIFTAPSASAYPGLSTQLNIPEISAFNGRLSQGYVDLKAGNSSAYDLQGYQKGEGPATLDDYNGILFWQDRANSTVKYNADGTYACGGPGYVSGCTKNASELAADRVITGSNKQDSRELVINATANFGGGLDGVLYQPRGSWISMQGNGDAAAGLQVISGALDIGGGGDVTLTEPNNPLLKFIATLIE